MKKLAFIFAIAVIVPALALAWLAMSSLRDQEIVVQSQRALLHQTSTDSLAADLNTFMDDVRLYFGGLVDELVSEQDPDVLSGNFNSELKARWGQALVGCIVTEGGEILSPRIDTPDPDAQEFLKYNRLFLSNQMRAEVYATSAPAGNYIKVEEAFEEADEKKDQLVKVDRKQVSSSLKKKAPKLKESEEMEAFAPSVAAEAAPFALDTEMSATARLETAADVMAKENGAAPQSPAQPGAIESPKESLQKVQPSKAAADKYNVAVANSKLRSQAESRRDFSSVNEYQQQINLQQVESGMAQGRGAFSGGALQEDESFGNQDEPIADSVDQGTVISPQNRRTVSPYVQIGNPDAVSTQLFSSIPSQNAAPFVNGTSWSSISPDNAGLSEIIGDQPEGAIARFLQDGLHVMLWVRHPKAPGKIFWAELDMVEIRERLSEIVAGAAFFQKNTEEVSLALLDSEVDVVAQTRKGFKTDWRHPFVASEVGEILPHWEVAAYWVDPNSLTKSAQTARFTLWLLVPILLAAIGFGSILIFRDVNREMFLARQKTDFVSNVSHELKTPLTSIRMFSDMLSTAETIENSKRSEYSGIISREAARLTRLINNLLDFSRMDRGDRKYNFEKLDAVALARETVANYRMHLEADGCELTFNNDNGESAWIDGDRDAVSQVLVNLLSNADKYACDGKEIVLEVATPDPDFVEIRVMDRGPGIRRKDAAKVFEKFFRADDSLATGIQGSGLGLTLARQIANGHRGELNFKNREGGGSCFSLKLPLSQS